MIFNSDAPEPQDSLDVTNVLSRLLDTLEDCWWRVSFTKLGLLTEIPR